MPQIFISYKRENESQKGDEIYRDEVIKALENLPYDYWYDKEQIQGGELWRQSIEDALENSFVCLVVVTDKILTSGWSFFEVSFALGFGITVIPWYANGNPPSADTAFGTLLNELNGIKDLSELKDELDRSQKNYVADFLNEKIIQMTLRSRILSHIAYAYLQKKVSPSFDIHPTYVTWVKSLSRELNEMRLVGFSDFWLNYSSAFSRKQKRIYNKLVSMFEELTTPCIKINSELNHNGWATNSDVRNLNEELGAKLKEIDKYLDTNLYPAKDYHQFLDRLNDWLNGNTTDETPTLLSFLISTTLTDDEKKILDSFLRKIPKTKPK